MIVHTRLVTDAVIDAVAAVLPTGFSVGDAEPAIGADGSLPSLEAGYVTVYRVPSGGRYEGSRVAGTEPAMQWIRYQVSTSGVQRDQVEGIADVVLDGILEREAGGWVVDIVVPGHAVIGRRAAGEVPVDQMGSAMAGCLFDLLVHRTGPVD